MYTKTMLVTPQTATLWLDTKNSHNRPVSQSTVERYVQEMRAGRWVNNAQPIIFGKPSDRLLNGQHRLKAIVISGVSVECTITWGVDDNAFDTIDDGNKRSLADVLAIKDEYKPAAGRTFSRSDGSQGCNECCNGERCDDHTHYDRDSCPYCLGSGTPRVEDNGIPLDD